MKQVATTVATCLPASLTDLRLQYKGASIAIVVFDVNNKESFKSCAKWYQDVKDASPNHNIPGALIQGSLIATQTYTLIAIRHANRHLGGQQDGHAREQP
jgi:hypothetical protein